MNRNQSNPLNAYKETQIKTASQGKLIVMLYDGALKCINSAIEQIPLKHRKYDTINKNITKAQDIITELIASLDFERGGDIARDLFSIYIYLNKQLLQANLTKEEKPLKEVKGLLESLRGAWVEVSLKVGAEQDTARPGGINIAG